MQVIGRYAFYSCQQGYIELITKLVASHLPLAEYADEVYY